MYRVFKRWVKHCKNMIILFITVVPLISGNLLQETVQSYKQRIKHNEQSCNVAGISHQLHYCDVAPVNDAVPKGTICTLSEAEGEVNTVLCDQGFLIEMNHGKTDTTLYKRRNKRGLEFLIPIVICFFLCGGGGSQEQPAPNKPPSITCPADIDLTAGKHNSTARATWENPVVSDPENNIDSVNQVSGKPSGSFFGEGMHTVVYKVIDDHGNSDTCSFSIKVLVIKCYYGFALYLENGRPHCTLPALYGGICSFSCNSGFYLSNSVSVTCERNGDVGKWTSNNGLACIKKQCGTPPEICNGVFHCTDEDYLNSICFPTCSDGYTTDITKSIKCDGDVWIGMDSVLQCKDVEPPEIACPSDIHEFAGVNGRVVIDWVEPTATDNSELSDCNGGHGITIQQIEGNNKGTEFESGYHVIKYKAKDHSQNSKICQFSVIVEELSCEPLVVSDEYLMTTCPGGFSLGSTCTFSCFLSYEMVGSSNVMCIQDPKDKNKAYWDWQNNTETFCEKLACPNLPAPEGGALACSEALGNTICTMSCSIKHRVPLGTSPEYVCNDEQVWIQGTPPNCTDKVHPGNAIKPGGLFYYYTGDCSDSKVQAGIKENFVDVMKNLETQGTWDNICPDYCTVDGVTVTCGPLNGRRRKRAGSSEITVSFKVKSSWQPNKDLWGNDEDLDLLTSFIENQVTNGSFDVTGFQTGSVVYGWIEMTCPSGLVPNYGEEGGCDGCSPGKYLNGSECYKCKKGTYQEKEYQTNCSLCPDGQSTGETGATNISHCRDKCAPGTYSTTGVVPCTSCPMGKYQTAHEATSCRECGQLKYTTTMGSNSESNCHALDMFFEEEGSNITLEALDNTVTSFTIGYWIKASSRNNTAVSILVSNMNFIIGDTITVRLPSQTFSKSATSDDFPSWCHIALTFDVLTKTAAVYRNSMQLASLNLDTSTSDEIAIPSGSRVIIQGENKRTLMSGFYMVGEVLPQSTIETHSQSCLNVVSGAVYNMNSVFKAEKNGVQLPKSSCDAVDECISNPCGAGNMCINGVGGFSCNCTRGYSGTTCDTPPDFCLQHDCNLGSTCVSHFSNYTCLCPGDFSGPFCNHAIVHGNWGPWMNTSECSTSCNGGTRTRERFCNDPEPDIYGLYCAGQNTSTVSCNEQSCPECKPSYKIKQYKNILNCTTTGDSVVCTVSCQPGYSFVKGNYPLDMYKCGPETAFEWQAKPPPCAPASRPNAISTNVDVSYQVDCSKINSFSTQLSDKLTQIQCVHNGTCNYQTSVSGCSGANRKRRSLSTAQVTINLFADLAAIGELNLEQFYANNIVSPGLSEILRIYSDIDQSLYQMNSTDVLTVDDNGVPYKADLSSLIFNSKVTCPDGKVEEDLICVDCPSGTSWSVGFCVICSKGTYQSQTAQLQCVDCPTGFSTNYVGSQSVADCSVPSNMTAATESKDDADSSNQMIIMIVAIAGGVIVITTAVVATIVVKRISQRTKRSSFSEQINRQTSIISIGSISKVHPVISGDDNYIGNPGYTSLPPKSGQLAAVDE